MIFSPERPSKSHASHHSCFQLKFSCWQSLLNCFFGSWDKCTRRWIQLRFARFPHIFHGTSLGICRSRCRIFWEKFQKYKFVNKIPAKIVFQTYCAWSYGVRQRQKSSCVSFARSHSWQTKSVISFDLSSEIPTHSPWNQLLHRSQPM